MTSAAAAHQREAVLKMKDGAAVDNLSQLSEEKCDNRPVFAFFCLSFRGSQLKLPLVLNLVQSNPLLESISCKGTSGMPIYICVYLAARYYGSQLIERHH